MAGQYTGLQKTYKIMDADGVALYHGVTYGSNNDECVKPTVDNAVPLGIVTNDERVNDPLRAGGDQTGRNVAVQLEGIANLLLAEPVAYGGRVILGAGGVGKALPSTPGTYNVIGFAEKSGAAGDVIPVRMKYHVFTV
ncbi:hypothetical protein E308F_29960 [Moorella sp. E308F]|uniref:hypothetical protein n=1 Tax=Moorella sp. E308F TaxID=2572682 RepID=UPI0010FFC594|nr:hypothetical protein [Moorella sp. E308F]GEA16750.1 hypothetical protein E308F_29960 [Moorella sp. E308F]